MAQLPVYRQQGNITTQTPSEIRNLDTFAKGSIGMQKNAAALYKLSAQWQASKDAVENLDGKNKLMTGISEILNEAQNYNDYNTPEELSQKQNELTQRMNELVPNIVSGFSNNQNAREFQSNGDFTTMQNTFKLQEIFRSKYGDMYMANLQTSADSALRGYTQTGDESYKQDYFNAIDTGVQSGYIDRSKAEKLKLSTNKWNYDYVYSQILDNPYFKASDEVMSKIEPVKQRALRNFQRVEQKRAQAEAERSATNDYFLNPSEDNLKRLYRLNPKLKGRNLESVMNRVPDFDVATSYDGMADALEQVKMLANMETSTVEQKQAYNKKAMEIGIKLTNMQVRDKNHPDGVIGENDKRKLFNMIYNDMANDNFRDKLKNMPNLSKEWNTQLYKDKSTLHDEYLKASEEFRKLSMKPNIDKNSAAYKQAEAKSKKAWQTWNDYTNTAGVDINKHRQEVLAPHGIRQRMIDLQNKATAGMLNAYAQGDVDGANKIKEQYGNDMVRLKYWNIPELQKKNLKAGDKFTVNGKVYSYQGFSSNDVIVEVN